MPTMQQVMASVEASAELGFKPAGSYRFGEADLIEATRLLLNADRMPRHKHRYHMEEAITTSDFPYLFGVMIDRELLARYRTAGTDFWPYCRRLRASNFNAHTLDRLDGLSEPLDRVGQKGEYLVGVLGDKHYTFQVFKRGRQLDISWESIINDGMGAFTDIPQRMSDSAINTDAYQVTSLYASATGPNALMFGAAIDGIDNVGALALTIPNLQTVMSDMAQQPDPQTGLPMGVRGAHLVVPPALEWDARTLLTSSHVQYTEVGAGAGIPVGTSSVIPQMGLQLHVNPWLPVVDVSGDVDTTWYLFADGSQGNAMGYGYLNGHESPEICMKATNKVLPSGAPISQFSGDFETDNIFYRVRVVVGGTQLDPRFAFANVG